MQKATPAVEDLHALEARDDNHPPILLDDVLELLLAWHTHVTHAEGRAGLHAFLCTTAPRYLSMIPHLRARHRAILERINVLRQMLAYRDPVWLVAEYESIMELIAVHDNLETELIADALENE